ncbi:HAD-IIIA family hydrolase [Nanoarchaeota archaeon]
MLNVDPIDIYESGNVLPLDTATAKIEQLKSEGKTVGLCHGGFDLTHPGHVKHFEMAKKECDVLFVSVTCDEFVTSRKGSGRPIYTDKLRAYMIACVEFVDYVVISPFQKGVEIIEALKPSFYIKGPDFVHKTTPGIMAERAAIKGVGGEMRYTTEPPMSTTKIIEYIKEKVTDMRLLVIIDRDGTLITNNDFLGREDGWAEELEMNAPVVGYISYLQTKYKTTKIVVTNQTGVARRYFDCSRVEEINARVDGILSGKGIKIDNWQYCPDADSAYAKSRPELNIDPAYAKDVTKRKPSTAMVDDGLSALGKNIGDFGKVVVLGDRPEDGELAENLKAQFIDVNDKDYPALVKEFS